MMVLDLYPCLTMCRYIICITIGPAFFSAAIYLCLARIVRVYGQHLWRVSPRFITITFMVADICALLLQIAGGGSASHSDPDTRQASLKTLQAGLAVHLIGIFAFVLLSGAFAYLVRSNRGRWDPRLEPLQKSTRFKAFLIGECPPTAIPGGCTNLQCICPLTYTHHSPSCRNRTHPHSHRLSSG